jgi:hypothetical protein
MTKFDPTCPDGIAPREWARIRSLEERCQRLESQMRGQTFLTPDEKDARIAQLEVDLAKYQEARVHDVDEKAWLSKRMTQLEAALRKYGIHTLDCASLRSERCDCGWTEQLTSGFKAETPVEPVPDKCANCGHSVQAHAADNGWCSCGSCSCFIPFAVIKTGDA